MGRVALEAIDIAHQVVEVASAKKATDIVLLDCRGVCGFTDFLVICSGDSERQIRAIRDEIGQELKKLEILPHHQEGSPESGWLLLDYHDIIVHIFTIQERERYRLEELWFRASPVVVMQ